MYIRKSTRKYKGKTYTNYLLVESVSTPKGPRQKTICSLGDLKPRPRSEWLKLTHHIEDALTGQIDIVEEKDPEIREIVQKIKIRRHSKSILKRQSKGGNQGADIVAVHVDQVTTEGHREAGPVHVGYQFWRRLGIEEILKEIGLNEKTRILTCIMTMARFVYPCSEHAMPDWIRRTALGDILGIDFEDLVDDALYRNLDKLHPRRVEIESGLVERERTLFNLDHTVFLYDLTSTYFEGQALGNPKAKRGYSRDKRPDCKQVVVVLVVNRDGFPLAHEIFEGNRQDRKSLGEMLDALDRRIGLKEGQTVVVDRGMAYEENLEEIRSRGLHYIIASRQCERERWLSDFEDENGFEEVVRISSPSNPFQKKLPVYVKLKRGEGVTYVLCISSGRKEKDRAIRERQERGILSGLSRLKKRIEEGRLVNTVKIGEAMGRIKERYPRIARYYCIEYEEGTKQLTYTADEEKRGKAEKLDGGYLLKTDRRDISADEIWRIYVLLTRAEDAFRDMKSPLAERPIFHQIERRVETHIFLCVLAYHLLVAIEKTLLDKGVHTSWGSVKETLRTHQVSTVVLPADNGAVLRIRKGSTPEPQHKEIYDLLGISHEVIRAKKIWDDT